MAVPIEMRRSEIAGLQWVNVDLVNGQIGIGGLSVRRFSGILQVSQMVTKWSHVLNVVSCHIVLLASNHLTDNTSQRHMTGINIRAE